MSLVRFALFSNALFSAATGVFAAVNPQGVSAMLGSVDPSEIRAVGLSLIVFAVVVAWVAREGRPNPLHVLVISGADLLWVLGTIPLLVFAGPHFSTAGSLWMGGVAGLVGTFAALQLAGLARQFEHPDPSSRFTHRLWFDVPASPPPEAMWAVISDLGSIAQHSPNLRSAALLNGATPGLGAARRCEDQGGAAWTELCTAWDPGRAFTLEFDADDPSFPFPFRAMIGGWRVEAQGDGTNVRLWWDVVPKSRWGGGLLVAVMAASLLPSMRRLVARMATHATANIGGEQAHA